MKGNKRNRRKKTNEWIEVNKKKMRQDDWTAHWNEKKLKRQSMCEWMWMCLLDIFMTTIKRKEEEEERRKERNVFF